MSHGFTRGKIDQALFIKKEDGELIVAQVYVDDIIFEMSMIGELTHFLGLQICQQDSGIFVS